MRDDIFLPPLVVRCVCDVELGPRRGEGIPHAIFLRRSVSHARGLRKPRRRRGRKLHSAAPRTREKGKSRSKSLVEQANRLTRPPRMSEAAALGLKMRKQVRDLGEDHLSERACVHWDCQEHGAVKSRVLWRSK